MAPRVPTLVAALLLTMPGLPLLAHTAQAGAPSYQADAVPFRWIELTAAAQPIPLSDNQFTNALPIGFNTTFFGLRTDVYWVAANGFLTMITVPADAGCCQGPPIPSFSNPNGVVAGFWTDLDPSLGKVAHETMAAPAGSPPGATKVLAVEFEDVPLKQDPLAKVTFQFQLWDNGMYEVHWLHADSHGQIATVGMEAESGGVGVQYRNQPLLEFEQEAVRFTPIEIPDPQPFLDAVEPPTGLPGHTIVVTGRLFSPGATVFFDGTPAATNFLSDTRLHVLVPNLPPDVYDLSVVNPGTNATVLVDGFTIRPPPDPTRPTYDHEQIPLSLLGLTAGATTLTLGDLGASEEMPLGFTTTFFSGNASTFWVSSDGYLTLAGPPPTFAGCCERGALPSPLQPNGLIAGLWADLDPGMGGTIRVQTLPAPPASGATSVLVAEYDDVPLFGRPDLRQTFQIHVYDTGVYEVHLQQAALDETVAVIGIEDALGDTGDNAFVGTNSVLTNVAFRFSVAAGAAPLVLNGISPSSGPVGTTVSLFGEGFVSGSVASFGGVAASTTFVNATGIVALVPSLGDGVVDVRVTNPDGQVATLTSAFDVTSSSPPTGGIAINFVTPPEGRAGDAFLVTGQAFKPGAKLFLDQTEVATTFVSSTALRGAIPGGLPVGPTAVRVVNPDGAVAFLPGGLTIVSGPRVASLGANVVKQGETFAIHGSGFEDGFTLLLDEVEVRQAIRHSPTLIEAIVPKTLPGGLYDVTVLGDGRSSTLQNGLLVKVPADVAVVALEVAKPKVATDLFTLPLDALLGQTIRVTVQNLGDETATGVKANLTYRPDEGAIDPFGRAVAPNTLLATFDVGTLAPGESRTFTHAWRPAGPGGYVLRAETRMAGAELHTLNNARETGTYHLVEGARGVEQCDTVRLLKDGCTVEVLYRRGTTKRETQARDTHVAATLRFNVTSSMPRFDFVNQDRIFDTHSESPDGTSTVCTVWRFFGGRGAMSVHLLEGEGLGGSMFVPTAFNRTSEGHTTRQTNTSTYVLGVETERQSTPPDPDPTKPRDNHTYAPPEWKRLELHAEGLKGDFTRCTITSPEGERVEMFTYAGLPANLEQKDPSFSGVGSAGTVVVQYETESSTTFPVANRSPIGDPL